MQTNTATSEAKPATTREDRGRAIAKLGGIRKIGQRFAVPSQSRSDAPAYVVDVVDETCTCPDWELRRARCKHIEACLFWIVFQDDASVTEAPSLKPEPRKTYSQNWAAYDDAQTNEKARVEMLLKSLCDGIEEPSRDPSAPGRPRIPLRDSIFAAVMKVYTTMSARRAATDIRDCAARGSISCAPHRSSLFRCLDSADTTAILSKLIEASAAPLAEIENVAGQHAIDSTGFSTVVYDRWFDQKHGKLMAQHSWVKLHVMIGTATHVVTGVKVSSEADCPLLPALLAQTTTRFKVREVSGDKAYLSKKNLEAIDAVGAVPFIAFKTNSLGMASASPHWRKMWAHFSLRGEEFLAHYHRRSNVESAMWMIKSKFGASVRAKLPQGQINEVLAKVLLHNLSCIVHAVAEFGIDADFSPKAPTLKVVP